MSEPNSATTAEPSGVQRQDAQVNPVPSIKARRRRRRLFLALVVSCFLAGGAYSLHSWQFNCFVLHDGMACSDLKTDYFGSHTFPASFLGKITASLCEPDWAHPACESELMQGYRCAVVPINRCNPISEEILTRQLTLHSRGLPTGWSHWPMVYLASSCDVANNEPLIDETYRYHCALIGSTACDALSTIVHDLPGSACSEMEPDVQVDRARRYARRLCLVPEGQMRDFCRMEELLVSTDDLTRRCGLFFLGLDPDLENVERCIPYIE